MTVYLFVIALSTAWTLLGMAALREVRRRPSARSEAPVSVLKPLCGLDASLEANLVTFFEQDHPAYELVFGVEGQDDPAIDVVRRLRARYPQVPVRLVVHEGRPGANPKVRNLLAMLPAAAHDRVLISDSNVAVPPHYLREMVGVLDEPGVGLATSLIAGTGDEGLGACLESLHLNGMVAAGIALPTAMGKACVIGKSMMFRRSVLDALGGLESLGHVLAEDFVMGKMFEAAGLRVRLCPTPVDNVLAHQPVRRFFERQVRWGMMRVRLSPLTYLLEPIATPLAVAMAAPVFGVSPRAPLAWALSLTLLRDAVQWSLLRGPRGVLRALPLAPLRDLVVLAAWAIAPFRRHVSWRGTRVRVSSGTRLLREASPAPPMPSIDGWTGTGSA